MSLDVQSSLVIEYDVNRAEIICTKESFLTIIFRVFTLHNVITLSIQKYIKSTTFFQLRKHFYAYCLKSRICIRTQIFHPVSRLQAFIQDLAYKIKNLYLS